MTDKTITDSSRVADYYVETLDAMTRLVERRRRKSAILPLVTGVIGSVAGAVIIVSTTLPRLGIDLVAALSLALGATVAGVAFASRTRSDEKLLRQLLRETAELKKYNETSPEELRAHLDRIQRFLKAEGVR